ncbi:hypothetical protein ACJRO7_004332 [Eucalyptus globulus]|uniref:Terpene synthase metal-binding domain-containing protein n=1 Tax=Eucalyptus globulus TaxID=34317 RepID=A0ABD3IZJ1_EUCGL
MSLETSANRPLPAKENSQMVERRSVDYHPSLWEDYLAKYSAPSNSMNKKKQFKDRPWANECFMHFRSEINTHLSVHGEDVLDQALSFSLKHLESIDKEQLSPPLAAQVQHASKQTIRRGVPRLEARRYISMYEAEPLHNKVLLSLAKLDFNHLQKQHQEELFDLARWWMGLDFKSKLPFARDRLVEGYFWILGVHFEPELAPVRRMMTKVIAMTSVLDDIYDVYCTYKELELFTRAVQRWDIDCINELPEYMQVFYKALIDVYVEIGEKLACTGRSYGLDYAKEAMKRQARSYFAEAKWLHQQHKPTMDEYMSVALVSSGYPLLAITSFLFNDPKILKASTVICRLMDDLATHKFEQGREHADSAVQCYLKQYNVTEQEAENDLRKQVDDAWKDLNEESLCPTAVAKPLLMGILNLTRVMDVLYKDGGDHYTNPHIMLKDYIRLVLMDPVQTF